MVFLLLPWLYLVLYTEHQDTIIYTSVHHKTYTRTPVSILLQWCVRMVANASVSPPFRGVNPVDNKDECISFLQKQKRRFSIMGESGPWRSIKRSVSNFSIGSRTPNSPDITIMEVDPSDLPSPVLKRVPGYHQSSLPSTARTSSTRLRFVPNKKPPLPPPQPHLSPKRLKSAFRKITRLFSDLSQCFYRGASSVESVASDGINLLRRGASIDFLRRGGLVDNDGGGFGIHVPQEKSSFGARLRRFVTNKLSLEPSEVGSKKLILREQPSVVAPSELSLSCVPSSSKPSPLTVQAPLTLKTTPNVSPSTPSPPSTPLTPSAPRSEPLTPSAQPSLPPSVPPPETPPVNLDHSSLLDASTMLEAVTMSDSFIPESSTPDNETISTDELMPSVI